MKLTIDRAALLKALNHVQSVVERRNTIPILSNVLITAEGDTARFSATDLDIEIIEAAPAEVATSGSTTAPAHTLHDIVRKLPEGSDVRLETSGDDPKLTLEAGRFKTVLPVLPSSDFPVLSADGMTHTFELGPAELMRLIDKTKFAISTEETRYYLNGVHIHVVNGAEPPRLRAVATDAYRLALVEHALPSGAEGMPGVIVPRKTVAELRRLLDGASDSVTISVSESKIRFDLGAAVLTSKLIEGTYPDYERVIPQGNDKLLKLDTQVFKDAVDRVATVSGEKSRSVRLVLGPDRLTLSANNPDAGQATEDISVDYDQEALEIGFNAKYLLDVANQIESDEAELLFADSVSPTLVLDQSDADARYVLMPLRV